MKASIFSMVFTFLLIQLCVAQKCRVANYPLNGDSKDASGNSYHGVVNGATSTQDRFGKKDGAYYFDGIDDYISLPDGEFLFDEYTYTAWVYANSVPETRGYYCVLHVGDTIQDQVVSIANDFGFGNVGLSGGSWDVNTKPYSTSVGAKTKSSVWTHVGFSRDNTIARLYVNGVLVDSTAISGAKAGYGQNPVANIGSRRKTSQFFHGKIDEVQIFNCALDSEEIKKIMNGTPVSRDRHTETPLSIYPNPASGQFQVEYEPEVYGENYEIEIYDKSGRKALAVTTANIRNTIDVSHLNPGVYFVRIKSATNTSAFEKLIVQ